MKKEILAEKEKSNMEQVINNKAEKVKGELKLKMKREFVITTDRK